MMALLVPCGAVSESWRSSAVLAHCGQAGTVLPRTSISKAAPQALQR
jgi:hypothetical protein